MATLHKRDEAFFPLGQDRPGLVPPRQRPPWWMVSLGTLAAVALVAIGWALAYGLEIRPSAGCTAAADWLELIASQEQRGEWQAAASNATAALSKPRLCDTDRALLAQKAVDDGLEALYASAPHPMDARGQRQLVDSYYTIKAFAAEHGVLMPGARRVVDRAYQVGAFLLAKEVSEEAFAAGELKSTERSSVGLYAATLRNLGHWWAETGPSEALRQEGGAMLATCVEIVQRYRLPLSECEADLRHLDLASPGRRPSAAPSPLLTAVAPTRTPSQ